MAHEKVYGICDSKCKVEVLPKEQAFGITKVFKETEQQASVYLPFPKNGERHIFANTVGTMHVGDLPIGIEDNYYSEIVVRLKTRVSTPSNFLNIPGVQYLNKNLNVSNFDVLHYHFTYDGICVCCYCTGYTDESIVI